MSNCEFEKYFDEYIRGELDSKTDISFHNHIQTCQTCPAKLDEFYHVHHILISRKRPLAAPELKKSYHKNGQLKYETHYKDGKKEGMDKAYYKDGKLWYEQPYKDGKKDGLDKSYWKSGKQNKEIIYKEGKAISGVEYKDDGSKAEMSSEDIAELNK